MTLEQFEKIHNIDKKELIFKDENSQVIRKCGVFSYDTYYDYDKNGDLDYPPKFEWDRDSKIFHYKEGRTNRDSFSIWNTNDIRIVGKKVSMYGRLEVHIAEGEIKIRDSNNSKDYSKPVYSRYMSDVEEILERFIKRIDKMFIDEELKALLMKLVNEAEIIKEERDK